MRLALDVMMIPINSKVMNSGSDDWHINGKKRDLLRDTIFSKDIIMPKAVEVIMEDPST